MVLILGSPFSKDWGSTLGPLGITPLMPLISTAAHNVPRLRLRHPYTFNIAL